MRRPKVIRAAILALALPLLAAGWGPPTAHAEDIYACMNNHDGTLEIVDAATTCKKNETQIQWPSVDTDTLGSLSCPSGQTLKYFDGSWQCDTDMDTLDLLTCSPGQTVKFDGTDWVCDPPRFELRDHAGLGQTVFDNQTGLEWETKRTCGAADLNRPHCVENEYSWSVIFEETPPDGTLFTNFLVKLNTPANTTVSPDGITFFQNGCYAGHCDWRIPNIVELSSLVGCGDGPPCIDPVFGPTQAPRFTRYWSSTTHFPLAFTAWDVSFFDGERGFSFKGDTFSYARAVRGGR